jgi:hypothetical protein
MNRTEILALLFCLAICISLIAIAGWVSRISASLVRIRNADALARKAQGRQGRNILSWVVSVSHGVQELARKHDEMLSKLHDLLDPTGERRTIPVPPGSPEELPPPPAPTVTPAPQLAPARADRSEDAAKGSWTGPPSRRTMLGDCVVHGPDRALAPSPPARTKR